MSSNEIQSDRRPVGPPNKLAIMIWLAVLPTLTVLNLALGGWLKTLSPVLRTLVLAKVRRTHRHLRTDAEVARVAGSAAGVAVNC
jgi:hypothetical protein